MENVTNFDDLFNPKVEVEKAEKKPSIEYKPSVDKGKNGIYQSVIRFIPWYKNPAKSIIDKWTCYLEDPIEGKGKYVDCPTSIGQPSPLHDMYWKLKNSDDVRKKEQAKIFSRNKRYFALIQVIKDKNAPELEGKILVWQFGKKIFDKYDAIVHPVSELDGVDVNPNNPFDLFEGRPLQLTITKVSGYPNYDQSKFLDTSYPMVLSEGEGENKKLTKITTSTDKNLIVDFLKTNSPDLSKYEFKPWDEDTKNYVNKIISFVNGASISDMTADVVKENRKEYSNIIDSMNEENKDSQQNSNIDVMSISLDDTIGDDATNDIAGIGEFDDEDVNDILSSL